MNKKKSKKRAKRVDADLDETPGDKEPGDEDKESGDEDEDEDEEPEEPGVKLLYSKMWYKNYQNYGIRQKNPPCKQIGTVGGRNSGLDQETMRSIADVVIMKMSTRELLEADLKAEILSLANPVEVD